MSNRFKKYALVIAISGATAMTGLVYAQTSTASPEPVAAAAQAAPATSQTDKAAWLNLGQIYDQVAAAGYTDIREIEREKTGYEVKATDAQGRSVKLYIDPTNGKVLKEKVRDRDDD